MEKQSSPQAPSLAGCIAQCFTRTFNSGKDIPVTVQQEAWRIAPNELRRLLVLAPRTMLFAHRHLSSLCHPHLSTVAWRCDIATNLTASQAQEDLLPWKLNAAAAQQQHLANLAKSRSRGSKEAQIAAYHGTIVPAEPSRAALGTRRFKALVEALAGDVQRHHDSDKTLLRQATSTGIKRIVERHSHSPEVLLVHGAGDDEEEEEESEYDDNDDEEEEEDQFDSDDDDDERSKRRTRRKSSKNKVSLEDKWQLLTEIHADIRLSNNRVPVDVLVPVLAPSAPSSSSGNLDDEQSSTTSSAMNNNNNSKIVMESREMLVSPRDVAASCVNEWRRSPLVMNMLRSIFRRMATTPSETAVRNSGGAAGGVAALKRALSIRLLGGTENPNDPREAPTALSVNAAVLPRDIALLSNPDRQRSEGTLSRQLSRIFSSDGADTQTDNPTSNSGTAGDAEKKQQQQQQQFLDSYVSVASYVLFQQRLFSALFHSTADEQVICAALLDFISDADYVGGGSLTRMTNDTTVLDPISSAQNARKAMSSFQRLSSANLNKGKFASGSDDPAGLTGSAGGSFHFSRNSGAAANNEFLLNTVPEMKKHMQSKVVAAARGFIVNNNNSNNSATTSMMYSSTNSAQNSALTSALASIQVSQHHTDGRRRAGSAGSSGRNSSSNADVFALTQAKFEQELRDTFGGGGGGADRGAKGGAAAGGAGAGGVGARSLLHVRDFSKFGVFFEKFAKFMFELCDNWAASHSVDGVAAFLGFISRVAFPSPIDTVWQRNLPLVLKNELKEKMLALQREREEKEKEAAAAGGGKGGGAGASLDAQFDMIEQLAAEEAAIEAGEGSDPLGRRKAARTTGKAEQMRLEREKFEALQLSLASFGKNKKKPQRPGGKPASALARLNAGAGGTASGKQGRASTDASSLLFGIDLPQIVVHSPTATEAAAARKRRRRDKDNNINNASAAGTKKRVRFAIDDGGGNDYASSSSSSSSGDDDDGENKEAAVKDKKATEDDNDKMKVVITSAEKEALEKVEQQQDDDNPQQQQHGVNDDAVSIKLAFGDGGDGEGNNDSENSGNSNTKDNGQNGDDILSVASSASSSSSAASASSGQIDTTRHKLPIAVAGTSSLSDPQVGNNNDSARKVPVPPSTSRNHNEMAASGADAPSWTTTSVGVASGAVRPPPQSAPASSSSNSRFSKRRPWFRGVGDGGASEMRNYPIQVEQVRQQTTAFDASKKKMPVHGYNPLYNIVQNVSPDQDLQLLSQRPAVTLTTTATQTPDGMRAIPIRLVRPFEERRLLPAGVRDKRK